MINVPTVFVLGAGASMSYGFPSGEKLHDIICEHTTGVDTSFAKFLDETFAIDPEDTKEFGNAFLRSQNKTIDEFLGRHPRFEKLGKLAIAYFLCLHEEPNLIHRIGNDDNWYAALWRVMKDGVASPDGLAGNQVRFITFNYDRSLEFFLHDATKHTFGIGDADALKTWQQLGIIHVYGQLGEFIYAPKDNARQYKVDLSKASLMRAAGGIKIVPEARDDAQEFLLARALFDWAERICFLGFGFDSLNVKRLGLKEIVIQRRQNKRSTPHVFASVFEKTGAEIDSYHAQVGGGYVHWFPHNQKNLMTLRSTPILLP